MSQLVEQMCQKIEPTIVQPTSELLEVLESKESLKNLRLELLRLQQTQAPLQRGYFDGNAIHLVVLLSTLCC